MNVSLMKTVDNLLGRIAVSLLPRPASSVIPADIRSILIIRPGGIGDAVLLVPALLAFKEKFPSAKITILAEQRNCAVFRLCPAVDRVLLYDRSPDLLKAVRGRYDVVIDSEQWHRLSAVVARITSAPVLIGFATNERSRLFTHQIGYSHDDYEAVSFCNLMEPLGVQAGCSVERYLSVPEEVAATASKLLGDYETVPFVTIFPGASIPERRWGADRFRRVAELLSVFGVRVVVVGGREDRQAGETIVAEGLGLNLVAQTSLEVTAAILDRSALLVSGDSGVLHIAVGLGKPTVSLFGPGRAKKWAPQGERHIVINRKLPCSPCTTFGTTPSCLRDAECLRTITPDEVANAVTMLLTAEGVTPSRCCKRDWIEVV
ncbi:MAG: heptosyltransferase [Geobacteraceae bacterium GWC2_55_20]|nr:MAG: heptosyltransferase [Geobacteraceae bacterium GWC2_55_20]OGU23156.1 MAG: heptosyltransferase [Geobacteraceae bacterium GWF2_54_21]HBA73037.1 glycosyltransferase family 9 protein [Geobacter sp.]